LDLDKGLGFEEKRRFNFQEKAKILGLSLDFEEWRETGIGFGFGSIF